MYSGEVQDKIQNRGFTLLEVVVALVLMAIALSAIFQNQGANLRAAQRAENMAQAIYLAQEKMTEIEIEASKKSMEALRDEESGEFTEDKLKKFKWKTKVEKVDIGCFFPSKEESNSEEQGFLSLLEKVFERAVRKAVVVVEWEEAGKTHTAKVAQLLVNFQELPTGF